MQFLSRDRCQAVLRRQSIFEGSPPPLLRIPTHQPMHSRASSKPSAPVTVVTAADERFAPGLAVMVRSLLDNFRQGRDLHLLVLNSGIKSHTKTKLLDSWDLDRMKVEWIRPSQSRLEGLVTSPWYSLNVYFRLLIPDLLPPSTRRAIYLDSDMLVMDDVTKLWNTSLQGRSLAAVRDMGIRRISQIVPHYRKLRLRAHAKYFNSGTLVMDLSRWRRDRIGEQVIQYGLEYRDSIRFPDQDALNAVLADKWVELDPRWNTQLNILMFRSWKKSPYDRKTYFDLLGKPRVLHYLGIPKPWEPQCFHPRKFLFYEYLDRTQWAGWRPRERRA